MKGKKLALIITAVVLAVAIGVSGLLIYSFGTQSSGGSDQNKKGFKSYAEQVEAITQELDSIKELNNGQLPLISLNSETGTPNFILGAYTERNVSSFSDAQESLKDVDAIMGIQNVATEYTEAATLTYDGTTQYHMQQMYGEYPVYGQQLVVTTNESGKVTSLSGDYATIGSLFDASINLSENDALSNAIEAGLPFDTEGTLVAYTLDGYHEMAYVFQTDTYILIVSAKDGAILSQEYQIMTALPSDIGSNNAGSYTETIGRDPSNSSNNMFNTVFYDYENAAKDDTYIFYDATRNIVYHDGQMNDLSSNWYSTAGIMPLQDSDNIWTTDGAKKAVTLYQNLSKTYDFYLNVLGLLSYDGNGGQILAFVNDGSDYGLNAFNWGPRSFDLNSGDSTPAKTATILSFGGVANYHNNLGVVGHEFTHALQHSRVATIQYKNQSGALMEAYSDVMGELIEAYYDDNHYTDWVHGERNIKSPASSTSDYFGIKYPQKLNGAGYYSGKDDNGGVHHNSTVISHAVYEIYQSGLQDIPTLTELLYRSWGYLTGNATFYDYRMAMLASAQTMGLGDEVIGWINDAFDKADIKPHTLPDDYLTAIDAHWCIVDAETMEAVADAKITVSTVATKPLVVAELSTDENGEASLQLKVGLYHISISASGYRTDNFVQVFSPEESANLIYYLQNEDQPADDIKCELGGTITDALNGQPLENVTMCFRKGYMVTSGPVDSVLYTDYAGDFYTDELDYGYYTIELQKYGYISSYVVVQAAASNWEDAEREDALNQSYSISPQLQMDDTLRIVLTWGAYPEDIDSHLIGSRPDDTTFHVYFEIPNAYYDGERFALLDVDDTTSYGPETVTLSLITENDLYHYYVHDYSNRHNANSTGLSRSDASVQVFSGNRLIAVYKVPTDGVGTVWHVFDYDPVAGNLIPINAFVDDDIIFG